MAAPMNVMSRYRKTDTICRASFRKPLANAAARDGILKTVKFMTKSSMAEF